VLCTPLCIRYEQFLNLHLVQFRLVFVFFCKSLVTVFLRTCANLDHFCFVFSVLVLSGLVFFQYRAKRLAGKNVSEMTRGYFVSSGT